MQQKSVSHSCYMPLANQLGTQAKGATTIWNSVWAQQKEKKKVQSHTASQQLHTELRHNASTHTELAKAKSKWAWKCTPVTVWGERIPKWLLQPCVPEASLQQDREIILTPVKAWRAHSSALCRWATVHPTNVMVVDTECLYCYGIINVVMNNLVYKSFYILHFCLFIF